jgi:hypothetical protein
MAVNWFAALSATLRTITINSVVPDLVLFALWYGYTTIFNPALAGFFLPAQNSARFDTCQLSACFCHQIRHVETFAQLIHAIQQFEQQRDKHRCGDEQHGDRGCDKAPAEIPHDTANE